ncbi:MAG: NifU family protein [Rhizobiales bacterium]|nr:NifU family protein [Hyphomicrobiales bacterium]NRB15257.1 NifU family protein [Hyphomicrobiales bacterium]
MYIHTEETPNPETLKFLPGKPISPLEPLEFNSDAEAEFAPIAQRLFVISGVKTVFLGSDFITITKTADQNWQDLTPALISAIMDHFMANMPILLDDPAADYSEEEFFEDGDQDLVLAIKDLIDTRIRPAVAQDGGDIVFKGFKAGVVYLRMKGACAGCPSSTMTLKSGIENLLRHFIPEVLSVEQSV